MRHKKHARKIRARRGGSRPSKKKYYQQVVFLQGHEADEPLRILDEDGVEATVRYLSQWDMGEGEVSDHSKQGQLDSEEVFGRYLLSYNRGLGYIGLESIVAKPRNW
jgi:hypothetical protein